MTEAVQALVLDLVEWVHLRERTYQETMDAWRTSCPRLPVWEEATERSLVELTTDHGRVLVRATTTGLALLREHRPQAYVFSQSRSPD
jgi:D-3-phosphoglycerate dehydrogenase